MKRFRAVAWPCSTLLVALLLTLAVLGVVFLSRHHNRSSSNKQIPASQVQGQETSGTSGTSTTAGWDEVAKLQDYSSEQLVSFLSPLVKISGNAYSMSQASSISGWKLSQSVESLNGGATAFVYEEETARPRVVAAFRGTTTRQDMCVDRLLFGELPVVPLPSESYCISTYTNQSLDYVSQGVSYIRKVREAYPGSPLVLTGHSLGGSLAILVSASLSTEEIIPVVAFSCPGTKNTMKSKSLDLSAELKKQTFVIGDEWDAVTTMFPQVGTVCLVQHKRPSGCEGCSSKDTTATCSSCGFQAHSLNGIVDNLRGGAKVACSVQ